ncbi:cation:H+ antiporter [Alicyclobacillus sacchari]|uniref:Cation:H+ antiporter n=1 Tax=Alicyclobacillus sacchari TaxID=392010 RepID=A0A4R8LP48_9BACL|nr:sodium:calcium antiporter [Alicyclobacillus sacchari]TDY48061.1 cation:H+ antiporter [Alicyclobacillus sacchari]
MLFVQILFSLAMVLFGAELFTNAIEWVGHKFGLGQGAVGSILAAVGTALPETAVPVTAILMGGGKEAEQVGIGGILGAPFLLATLGGMVIASATLAFRFGHSLYQLHIQRRAYMRDMLCFLTAYVLSMLPALFPLPQVRHFVPFALVLLYIGFVVLTIRDKAEAADAGDLKSLYLQPGVGEPSFGLVSLQLLVSLALIVGGAHILTGGVEQIALQIGLPTFVLSALIIPLATELPETLNSVVWIRQGKDSLALGNVTGAMVFQSTLVPALGIWMTPWNLTAEARLTAVLTFSAALFTVVMYRVRRVLEPWTLLIASTLYFVLPMLTLVKRFHQAHYYWIFGGVIAIIVVMALFTVQKLRQTRLR